MGEASVLKRTVPTTLLFLGAFSFCMTLTSAAPFQSALRLPRDRGCYYLMKHYSNGERIETNEPCLNCTCVNSMLMCYLRICPFTKPAGPECVIRREEGECCPTVWCPGDAIPTPPPTEIPTTPEPMGCYAGGEAYVDGAQLPRNPDNPCEVCYCIRNSTACVMQECELKVEGCTPVYREPSCCPSRYNCSRYVATTLPPGPTPTIMPTGCLVNNHLYADGERVTSEKPCNHCYCMRDTVVCAVEKCHAPGDGCIPQTVPEGQCCPDRYDCQGMEVAATDITTDEPHTTTPSIVSSESDLTDRSDTIETETPPPFSASPDVKTTTTSSSADVEGIKLSSTPLQEDTTREHTTVGSSEETAAPTSPIEKETAAPTSPSEEETAAPTSPSEEETVAPTSSSEKGTAAPTSSSEEETAAPTSSSEKETAAPTSSTEKETASPTSPSEDETAAPTSSSEKETAAPISSTEKETASPASPSEEETAAPTSPSEEETAAPTSSNEKETAAPISSTEKETASPASPSEEETAAPTSSSEKETAAPTSSSEEKTTAQTMAHTASPEEIIQHSTLTFAPEETHTQPGTTVSIAEEKTETTSSSSTTEILSTELPKLSSQQTIDSKITSTLLPISEKITESGGLTSTVEELEPTDLPERSPLEEKKESVTTISVEDMTTISHDLSSKQPEQEATTASYADIISSTSVPEQFESSSLAEGEETKLTAEMEGRDKITQMITEFTDKPQSSEVSTPIISLGETTTLEEHISLDKVTSTLAPKQETDSVHTMASSESTTIKFVTKSTQAIVVEETSSEAELFTTGTTTTSKPILPGSIPGEGNCHYATGTYQNGDAVVPVHPCEKDCVCNNSVVACDIIVCEPVFEDSTNCRIITKPDECCPRYECDPTIDQELPPALNQTKDHSIPEAVTSTSVSAETDLPERTTTEKPTANELVKLTTTKEESIESTTERKEDLASPFSKETTTKSSIVSQTEDRKEQTTEFTEPSLDERKAGTHPTDSEIEIVTTSDEFSEHIGIDISSEFPSEITKLPDVSLVATSSTEGKFTEEATSVAPEGISKETTEFPIEVKVTEAASLEITKHSTVIDSTEVTQGVTEQSEKSKSEMEDHTKVSGEGESEATTLAQTQPPLETSTIKKSITTTTEVSSDIESTTLAESTETLELLGYTKPAIQIANQTSLSETSPSKPENELLVTTTKASVELPEEEFDKTLAIDIVEHSTTSVPVSEETTEHPEKVSTKITTSEETVKTEDFEAATTPQTVSSSDTSTQPPADVQTEEAVVLTEKTQETTHKPTSAVEEIETTQSALTSSASESSQPQEITTKTLETTTAHSSSKEDNSFDVIHKTSSIETTSKIEEDEVTKPTISTTEKVATGIIDVETETSQETSASPPEHSFGTETTQYSQSTPGDVISKGTKLPTEPEIKIEEKTTKVSLEESTTKSTLDITKSILDKTDSETTLSGKETTNTVVSTEFESSTQSTEIHKQTQTTTEGEKFAITDERTTLGVEATELFTTVPPKENSKETTSMASLEEIAKTIETTSEKVVTISDVTTKKVVTFTDTTAKEGVDKTTVATNQGDQTVSVNDVTDVPLVVTSDTDDLKTQSVLLPKPTAIEAEIKVQPDAKPPATEIIVGRYTTTTPSTIQEVDTTSEFSFSVEVITGSSPEVQDQKTEAIAFTTPKSVETTTEDRKITTSTIDKVPEVQTDEDSLELVKLSTPSEIIKEVPRTSHAEEDTTSESISAIKSETQSIPSQLTEEASVASTTEHITTKLQNVSGVQEETTTEKFDEISIATTTKQVFLETTVTPKYTTIARASAEEQETSTELKPSSLSEIITMTTTPEKHSTELPFNKTENIVTEATKIVELDTSSVTEETFFGTSTTEKSKDLEDQTTPASQLEKRPTVIENVEDTTLKEVDKVTDSATTVSEILLVTTPDNLSERTVSSITQETRKETPSEVTERTTIGAETHKPEESTSAFEVTEKATTHIVSEETATEVSSILDVTTKVTTRLPELGETTIHTIEDTTGSISTTSEETSEKSKVEVSQTSDHTTAEVEITTLESITTKTPVDEVLELTESALVGISEETTHISIGTKESESLDTSSHTSVKTAPTVSIETTPTILTGVSEELTSKSSDEITSTPLNNILEQTTTHKLHEDVSGITSATTAVEHSEETQAGVIIESTSQSPDITTQRIEFDLAQTTSQKPLESTRSPTEITSKSTEDITPESATSSVSKFTLSETTVKSTEEVISHVTAEAEKSTLTTFEEIATTEPEVSKLTSKLSTEELLGVTLTPSTISTELPITTGEEETEGVSTKSEISFTETQKPDVTDVTKETDLQPEVPSEETHIKHSTIQDTSTHPVTDAKIFTKEELLTESTVPFDRGETSKTTIQTLLETEVPSEEPQKQDITIQETSTEYAKDLTKTTTENETEKTESAFSSTVTQEIYVESTTQTPKQPEVPSEIPHKQDITIKLETTKSEPITQSTLIHEETEMAVKGQTETTVVSGELEKSTTQPSVTEQFPVEQETVSASKVKTHEPTEFTSLYEDGSTTLNILSHLSTAQTILDRGTSIVTELDKENVEVSTTQKITTTLRPSKTEEQEKTTEQSYWTSWFTSSVPTTHSSPEETPQPIPTTTTTTKIPTSSPKPESTDDSSEEPIFVQKGACVFNGIVYQSAEQIPRTDACEFCFCFRGDIICLHQGCPPPMTLCYEREVPGFCCPHYVCHSPKPIYNVSDHTTKIGRIVKRSVEIKGCEANGETYRVGEIMQRFSTPCLQCKCDPKGSMTCEPQKCKPQEPLLLKLNKEYFRKRQ